MLGASSKAQASGLPSATSEGFGPATADREPGSLDNTWVAFTSSNCFHQRPSLAAGLKETGYSWTSRS
jgi:hypothetical protein